MKKALLASAVLFASSAAYAADYGVAHPFYTPAKGKTVSITALDYEHRAEKDKDDDQKTRGAEIELSETLELGVTDNFQVGVDIARSWETAKAKSGVWNIQNKTREYVNSWGIKAGYNIINDGKAFLNTSLKYGQDVTKDDNPFNDDDEHGKYVKIDVFGGYNFDKATIFGSIAYERQIDGEKQIVYPWGNVDQTEKTKIYSLKVGAFKQINKEFSAYTSLSMEIDRTTGEKEKEYWWNVGADYSIAKNMAVETSASYMLDDDADNRILGNRDVHRGYKVGVDFKIAF